MGVHIEAGEKERERERERVGGEVEKGRESVCVHDFTGHDSYRRKHYEKVHPL